MRKLRFHRLKWEWRQKRNFLCSTEGCWYDGMWTIKLDGGPLRFLCDECKEKVQAGEQLTLVGKECNETMVR